jgi:hypothetical protein
MGPAKPAKDMEWEQREGEDITTFYIRMRDQCLEAGTWCVENKCEGLCEWVKIAAGWAVASNTRHIYDGM